MTRGRTREGGNENKKGQQARYVAHPSPITIVDGDDEGRITTTATTSLAAMSLPPPSHLMHSNREGKANEPGTCPPSPTTPLMTRRVTRKRGTRRDRCAPPPSIATFY
jgi:hypothetical protein